MGESRGDPKVQGLYMYSTKDKINQIEYRRSGEQKRGADSSLRISMDTKEVTVAASVSMETTSLKFDSSCPICGLSPLSGTQLFPESGTK